jgi:hypothetical protein
MSAGTSSEKISASRIAFLICTLLFGEFFLLAETSPSGPHNDDLDDPANGCLGKPLP